MQSLMGAVELRRLADALDRLTETTKQTGVTLCAYGTDNIEIDGITLPLQSEQDGERIRYLVDLAGR
ncbi:hypothetical protein OH540_21270 [Streptomyces sp. BPPL-273]|uniref:hypothetical protein n=1 Tax=Streptomyces sp. BPPL-273 TaxID=2987533 RepID=UPI0024AE9D2D|nr:hypothetical protein [Streptomyces sp. BPPL-273]WHM32436.1 hypothetical protein OH540_21270 [Streptomyces sp. BPPL-273]